MKMLRIIWVFAYFFWNFKYSNGSCPFANKTYRSRERHKRMCVHIISSFFNRFFDLFTSKSNIRNKTNRNNHNNWRRKYCMQEIKKWGCGQYPLHHRQEYTLNNCIAIDCLCAACTFDSIMAGKSCDYTMKYIEKHSIDLIFLACGFVDRSPWITYWDEREAEREWEKQVKSNLYMYKYIQESVESKWRFNGLIDWHNRFNNIRFVQISNNKDDIIKCTGSSNQP